MAMLLSQIKEKVGTKVGEEVIDAVISVPAFFTNAQRQATIDAGKIAGLNVIRVASEAAATALAFNAKNRSDEAQNVVVFDMGAGKLDCSLARLEGGVCSIVKSAGNTQLGGSDIDARLAEKIGGEFGDLGASKVARRKLRSACEQAKIALSGATETDISLPGLEGGKDLNRHLERAEFEEICGDLLQSAIAPLTELFDDSSIAPTDVSKIILVGGSTKIPRVRQLLTEFFGENVQLYDADGNDLAVAQGAALQGALTKGVTTGMLQGVALRNSTTLSLGISLANGLNFVILPRGTVLPAKIETPATTFRDNQQNVGFDIVQGERPLAADNMMLGHITVEGIQMAKRGVPKLVVQMELTEDGLLLVSAKDLKTGAAVTARVENRGNLSQEDVQKLLAEAEAERSNDPHVRERTAARSDLGFFITRADQALQAETASRRVPFAEQESCRIAIQDAGHWLEAHQVEEPETYREKQTELQNTLSTVVRVR
jgi:molecular chaperone DnaK (HSP70)